MDDNNMYTIRRKNKTFIYYKPNDEAYYGDIDNIDTDSDNTDNTDTDTDTDSEIYNISVDTEDTTDNKSINTTSTIFTQFSEESSESKELFNDNLECVDDCSCTDLDIIDDDTDYEIINESKCIPIKNRYRKQTWYEYFRKLYMVTVILIVSIVIYFYYSYSKRRENVVSKL